MAGTQEFGIGLIGLGIGQQYLLGYQSKGVEDGLQRHYYH